MSLKWRSGNVNSRLPRNAIRGGTDVAGLEMFVGRAMHCCVMLPAKIIPGNRAAYVSYNGLEVAVQDFEVLTGSSRRFTWVPASDGNVAPGAVSVGSYGCEEIFIGRAPYQNSLTIGKIHPSHRVLYIPFNGSEISLQHYEVLVNTRGSRCSSGKQKDKKKEKKKDKKKDKKKGSSSSSSSSSSSDSD